MDRSRTIGGLALLKVAFIGREEETAILDSAIEMLKEQESEWLEDSDPGQEYGTTWACWKCGHSIHKPFVWNPYESGYKYCPHCGAKMKVRLNAD